METSAQLRRAEWRRGWPLVVTGFVGYGYPAFAFFALGLFMEPLTQEFGWSRTQVSAGASIASLVSIPLAPLFGSFIDRWGVRRIAIPGVVLTALSMASFSLANGSTAQWLVLWTIYAICILLLKSTLWTAAVNAKFVSARSLALAVVLSGASLATAASPPLTYWLIESFGWRQAWVWMAVCLAIPLFLMCLFFLFDAHDEVRSKKARGEVAKDTKTRPDLPGLSVKEAIRSVALYRIGLATLLTLLLTAALVVHKVPLLVEMGVTRQNAAYLASLTGIAGLIGAIATGWLMDRVDAGLIGFITNMITAVMLVLLLAPFRSPTAVIVSMLVVGFAGGAKLEICAYLTSIYAGMRNYGTIFGVMASIVAVTSAVGPLLGGLAYDLTGGYDLVIYVAIPSSVLAALLIFRLGPYPAWSEFKKPGKVKTEEVPAGA